MKNTPKTSSSPNGFTLLEIMVVVSIIGIMAAVAIPTYTRFQARARQSEAKIALSAIYTAQKSYSTENSTYTSCLRQIGYEPTGYFSASSKRYYAIGFTDAASNANICGPQAGDQACATTIWTNAGTPDALDSCATNAGESHYVHSVTARQGGVNATEAELGPSVSKSAFSAGAAGNVSSSDTGLDRWQIDQDKIIRNTAPRL